MIHRCASCGPVEGYLLGRHAYCPNDDCNREVFLVVRLADEPVEHKRRLDIDLAPGSELRVRKGRKPSRRRDLLLWMRTLPAGKQVTLRQASKHLGTSIPSVQFAFRGLVSQGDARGVGTGIFELTDTGREHDRAFAYGGTL